MERNIQVTEFLSFEEAFSTATKTKEDYSHFQMGTKVSLIRQYGERWFVDNNFELWHTIKALDGARFLHKAEVYSILSNANFEIVQFSDSEVKGRLNLRFSDCYVSRKSANFLSGRRRDLAFYQR
jgi:hypothetical protein